MAAKTSVGQHMRGLHKAGGGWRPSILSTGTAGGSADSRAITEPVAIKERTARKALLSALWTRTVCVSGARGDQKWREEASEGSGFHGGGVTCS